MLGSLVLYIYAQMRAFYFLGGFIGSLVFMCTDKGSCACLVVWSGPNPIAIAGAAGCVTTTWNECMNECMNARTDETRAAAGGAAVGGGEGARAEEAASAAAAAAAAAAAVPPLSLLASSSERGEGRALPPMEEAERPRDPWDGWMDGVD